MSLVVLNPVQEAVVTSHTPASRLATLTGKTLGLWNNEKLNAAKLVEFIRTELAKEFSFNVVRGTYNPAAIMPADGWGEINRCDAVIFANGDCGACSTSGIANAIEIEKRGIPTMLVSTPPFIQAVTISAGLRGMPNVKWAVVPHPIGSLEEDELRKRAVEAARQFRELVLQPAVTSSAA